MKQTFEDFLMEKHAEQHVGTKETLVDGWSDWLVGLEVEDFLDYGDMFAKEQSKKNEIDYSKAIAHCNYDEAHCPGIFTFIKKGEMVCNECGMPLTEMVGETFKKAKEQSKGLLEACKQALILEEFRDYKNEAIIHTLKQALSKATQGEER